MLGGMRIPTVGMECALEVQWQQQIFAACSGVGVAKYVSISIQVALADSRLSPLSLFSAVATAP